MKNTSSGCGEPVCVWGSFFWGCLPGEPGVSVFLTNLAGSRRAPCSAVPSQVHCCGVCVQVGGTGQWATLPPRQGQCLGTEPQVQATEGLFVPVSWAFLAKLLHGVLFFKARLRRKMLMSVKDCELLKHVKRGYEKVGR